MNNNNIENDNNIENNNNNNNEDINNSIENNNHNKRIKKNELNILIGCTGSVATVKISELVIELKKQFNNHCLIKIIFSNHGRKFLDNGIIKEYNHDAFELFMKFVGNKEIELLYDENEWNNYEKVGKDPVVHIELRKWADIFLIAPLSANTLAKLANGLSDNMITCVARAWDPKKKIIIAPAMNTYMWMNPFTEQHINILKNLNYFLIIPPISKTLACNDTGIGAMAKVIDIVNYIKNEIIEI